MLSYCNEDCQDILCISDRLYLIDHPLLSYMEELKQSIVDMVHCQAMGDHSLWITGQRLLLQVWICRPEHMEMLYNY